MDSLRLALAAVLLIPPALRAEPAVVRPEPPSEAAKDAMEAGIKHIFSFDFDDADVEFNKITAEDAAQPYGDFGRAGSAWARYVYQSQQADAALEREFERRTNIAIDKAEAWLVRHPRDVHALLCLGGSYGLRSRLAVIQGHWLTALSAGRKAIKATRQAAVIDPQFPDAYLGIGMWEYYADVFPRFIKILGSLLLGGDRLKGIKDLTFAAEKGRYANIAAELLLIEVYTEDRFGAKDPKKALAMIEDLRAKFPKSPIFHQIEQVCFYVAGDLDSTVKTTSDYMKLIDAKAPYYPEADRARMHVALGTVSMARQDLPAAKESFIQAAKLAGEPKRPSRWGVWGLLRLAQTEDLLGQRPEAKRDYRAVLDFPDIWGFHELAQQYLRRPYVMDGSPGPLPPP